MFETSHLLVKITAFLFIFCTMTAWLQGCRKKWVRLLLAFGLLVNGAALFMRYYTAWPMMPMYLGGVALPFCLGLIAMGISGELTGRRWLIFRLLITLSTLLALMAAFFPKDFYLPFLKSATIWSHLFLWFGVIGKALFLVSAIWAISALWSDRFNSNAEYLTNVDERKTKNKDRMNPDLNISFHWTVWGFAFWTLSMFAGELWSYLGWGTPVVWDEPAITTTMATWFFYICLLHLHLTGSWSVRARGIYTASGALVVLVLNCVTDFGPFRSFF